MTAEELHSEASASLKENGEAVSLKRSRELSSFVQRAAKPRAVWVEAEEYQRVDYRFIFTQRSQGDA